MTERKDDIEQLAKELADKIGSDNLLNFCETDENGHTKFLHEILRRGIEGGYPCFLESFFEILNGAITRPEGEDEASGNEKPSLFDTSACKEFQLRNQYQYIDELITFENEHDKTIAVIIENKACRAPDQKHQLDRYICACAPGKCTCQTKKERAAHPSEEINAAKIFVVYLTKDGGEPPTESLSKNKKCIENRRPICINYKDDILPWLRETVLPECRPKDAGFIRSLQMYVDFLEGFVCEQELPPAVEQSLSKILKSKLKIEFEETAADGLRVSKEKFKQFENVYKGFRPQQRTEKKIKYKDLTTTPKDSIATRLHYFYAKPANSFKRLSDEYWKTKYGDEMATNIKKSIGWNNKYIWYGKRKWNKDGQRIHVEWDVSPNGDYKNKKQINDLNGADTLFAALYKVKLCDIRLKIHFEVGKENHVSKDQLPEGAEHLADRGQIWMPPQSWTEDKSAIGEVARYQKTLCIEEAEFGLDHTFADLDEAERRTFLTALYDKAAEGLKFVYDKMEEHK